MNVCSDPFVRTFLGHLLKFCFKSNFIEIVCRTYVLMRIIRDFGCSYIRYQKIEHFFTLKIITFVCISASLHTRMKNTRTSNVVNFHLILNIYSYCGVILIFLLLQNWEEFLYSADEYVFCDII